jgi:hypothetical protein
MKKLSLIMVMLCSVALTAGGCKKKNDAGAGSGSAATASGSADTGSAGSAAMGSGSADTGSGSSMTAGSGSAAADTGAAGCSATAYKSTAGAFCIEGPKGWKVTETKDKDEVTVVFEDEKTLSSFAVTSEPDENNLHYTTMAEAFDARAKDPENDMQATELGGGVTGKMQVYTLKGQKDPVQIFAIVKGKTHFYNCGGENRSPAEVPVVPDACKTLRPTD